MRVASIARLVFAIVGCVFARAGARAAQSGTDVIWPAPQWTVSTPEEQGLDSTALTQLVSFGERAALDSLLVTRHGRLVVDAYYAPYKAGIRHAFNSTTKSVIGTLIGMAVQQRFIDGVDQPVGDFFPEIAKATDDRKRS